MVYSATGADLKWSRASVLPRVSPDPKSGGFAVSLARDYDDVVVIEMAACAGIAPATFRSTGGCSS